MSSQRKGARPRAPSDGTQAAIFAAAERFDKPVYGRTRFHDEVRIARSDPKWRHIPSGIGGVVSGYIEHIETGQMLKMTPYGWIGVPRHARARAAGEPGV